MKRINGASASRPRVKLLPSCLALALALGSSVLPADFARANTNQAQLSATAALSAATVPRAHLSAAEHKALADFMRGKQRTPPPVPAASVVVSNCNDSGPGSFRQAVSDAQTGDTIDLTATGCSTITLTTGDIITAVDDLTLQGPGVFSLTISGGDHYRPLEHIGSGTLSINDLTISHGKKYLADGDFGNANGGCVSSAGTASISNSWIKYCDAGSSSTSAGVHGGAVFGNTGVVLVDSSVTDSYAHSTGSYAYGGGIYTPASLTVAYSTISGNTAASTIATSSGGGAEVGNAHHVFAGEAFFKYSSITSNAAQIAGGLYTTGDVFITNSTVSANHGGLIGGIAMLSDNVTGPWKILNSTISGNTSEGVAGGIYSKLNTLEMQNSTVAFNTAKSGSKYGAGLAIRAGDTDDLQSTIISNNTTDKGDGEGPLSDDVGGLSGAALTGANNLIYFASTVGTPVDTIELKDPLLKHLAFNGGDTATHSISPSSPALNAGNNALGSGSDQRGSGFPRTLGGQTDIGAFEFDASDVIFADGFDD